jgi:hypothetical protein
MPKIKKIYKIIQLVYFFILLEFQSSRFFSETPKDARERSDFRMPSVFPLVVFTGKGKWTAVRTLKDYYIDGERFGKFQPNLEYYLIDIDELKKDEIKLKYCVVSFVFLLDQNFPPDELLSRLEIVADEFDQLSDDEKSDFLDWYNDIFMRIINVRDDISESFKAELVKKGDEIMTYTEKVRKSGGLFRIYKKIGAIKRKGFNREEIITLLDLEDDEIDILDRYDYYSKVFENPKALIEDFTNSAQG